MKAFFDTSVLVALFSEDHDAHAACFGLLKQFPKDEISCAGHSLVEFYSVMTRLPIKLRATAGEAMLMLQSIRQRMTVVALTAEDYSTVLETLSAQGVTGGLIYDAMIAATGLKAEAETLYTLNIKDWQRLGANIAAKLKSP